MEEKMKKILLFSLIVTICFAQTSVTVYNENLGLIKETKSIQLEKGEQTLQITDVAAQLDPTSVLLKSVNYPDDVRVLEQNFRYDLVNVSKIYHKFIGSKIRFYTENGEKFTGKLLSAGGSVVLQNDDGSVQIINAKQIVNAEFPELPEGLITRPTLDWTIQSARKGDEKLEISYLTSGMSWHAEYLFSVLRDGKFSLASWVSIENESGATYENAKLKLVAGDIHRAERQRYGGRPSVMMKAESADAGFQERELFEYHVYELPRKVTLQNQEIKQIALFDSREIESEKYFRIDGGGQSSEKLPARVFFDIENSEKSGLGMPLPAGKIRMFSEDSDGSLELVGEDRIEHTPKKEIISIQAGKAFDVVAERTIESYEKTGKKSEKFVVSIEIRNRKNQKIPIRIFERISRTAKIKNSTHDFTDTKSGEVRFDVTIDGEKSETVKFTIINEWK